MDKYGQIAKMVHFFINNSYKGKDNLRFLDLTCGNGNDSLFLSNLAGKSGCLIAFDIQEYAIERTKKLLKEKGKYKNYKIIKEGHEFVGKYLTDRIDAAVFNLGYLPQYSKEIVTQPTTTIKSLNSLLPYLKDQGRIYITAYVTHDKGYEISKIHEFLKNLDKVKYNVIHMKLLNKSNSPPELFIVEQNA